MSHLSDEQLSALADGALDARARDAAERHLQGCAACRDSLARLASQDRELRAALEHDPGEDYFATFAARVGGRIRAAGFEGAQAKALGEGRGLAGWFRSPRKLALLGAAAAVIAGAGIVMVATREARMPALRSPELEGRAAQEAPGPGPAAPPAASVRGAPLAPGSMAKAPPAPREEEVGGSRAISRTTLERREGGLAVPSGRAFEVRRGPTGEDVPVRGTGLPGYHPPAPAPGTGARVQKPRYAQPLEAAQEQTAEKAAAQEPAPAGASDEKSLGAPGGARPAVGEQGEAAPHVLQSTGGASWGRVKANSGVRGQADEAQAKGAERICGIVLDERGRPVAGAQVVNRATGASVASARDGRFCLAAAGPEQEVAVMAVGFEPKWQTLPVDRRARIELRAVSVLGEKSELAAKSTPGKAFTGTTAPKLGPAVSPREDAFAREGTFLRVRGQNAERLTALAERMDTPGAWDSAAAEWRRVLDSAEGGPLENRARYELARSRFRGWRVGATEARTLRAREALRDFLAKAPPGAPRDSAQRWLEELPR